MTTSQPWVLKPAQLPDAPVLNAAQAEAARPIAGVRVVLGGPGTGKTSLLRAAVGQRLRSGSRLDRLVVLTASRQAAQTLRRELIWELGGAEVGARITTIHGFSLGLLRELGDPNSDLRLLRAPEQEQRLRDLLEGEGPSAWPPEVQQAATTRGFARQLREVLARARQLGLDPETIIELAQTDEVFQAVGRFFELYLTIADFDGALDYTELVHRARLLLTDQAAAAACRARFDAVIIDDAQELDQVSAHLVKDLAGLGLPLLVCADPQQRLGSFRGASAATIPMLRAIPGAVTSVLTQGYRNQAAVTDALNVLRSRLDATDAPPPPEPAAGHDSAVTVTLVDDSVAEVTQLITHLRRAVTHDRLAWSDLAVIARSGRSQLAPLARELSRSGIPVEVAGDELALGSQRCVQVLLTALDAAGHLTELTDHEAAELLAGPLAGVDALAQRRLARALQPRSHSLSELLSNPDLLAEVPGPEAAATAQLAQMLHQVGGHLERSGSIAEALWTLWSATEWPKRLQAAALAGNRSAHQDLDAVVELFELASRRSTLVGVPGAATFRSEVAREEIPADTGRELALTGRGVRLLTAHRARSGSWQRVFIVGVSEGIWPQTGWRGLVLDPDRLAPDHLDAAVWAVMAAERRSFYVACSRAQQQLHISAPIGGQELNPASRFCWELGVEPVRVVGHSRQRHSPDSLIADLRRVAADPAESAVLRRAAALRLAHLGSMTSRDRPLFPQAKPESWWGIRQESSPTWTAPTPLVITGSGLKALLTCPRQWFLTRKAGADRPRDAQATVGELIHLLAQRAAVEGLQLPQLLAELDQAWPQITFETRSLAVTEKNEAIAALTRFAAWHRHHPGRLLGAEVHFEVSCQVAGQDVTLVGNVDRLELTDEGLTIVDLKTGRNLVAKTELAEHEQLGIYQRAASLGAFTTLACPETPVAPPYLLQLRHGQGLPVAQIQDVLPPTGSWLDDKLQQAVEILQSGTFEAREGPHCAWCQVRNSCPALRGGLG